MLISLHKVSLYIRLAIYLILIAIVSSHAVELGTIYCHLDLDMPSIGVGTTAELTAIVDSIRTVAGGTLYSAGPCLQEYQFFRLHSTAGRPLADIEAEPGDHCTGSPCYRDYYTHSSPSDLDRELVSAACYFFVSDSLDSANAFLRSDYAFIVNAYRPGNLEISMTERYTTLGYNEFAVVSDTTTLTITGPAMDCPPLKEPRCGEVYGITPLEAKGVWHHVVMHDGYQYRVTTSPTPPGTGIDIDTNYIELTGLIPETGYYLHVRAWCNCESSGRSYSPWTSIPFNTMPQPITTIQTSPHDLMFIAEMDTYYTSTEFDWPYEGEGGPCHWIEAISPQVSPPGPIYFYKEWSDGGAFSHCHNVSATNVTITCYYDSLDANFVSQVSPPPTVCAGSRIPVSITMLNSGSLDWTEWDNINLWSQNPPLNDTWGISDIEFEGSVVSPGGMFVFEFTVTAPDSVGDYIFEWEMGKSGVSFFGEHSDSITVTVVGKPVATASNDGPYCQNETARLFGGPDGMSSYHWTGPSSFSSWVQSPVIGPGTPSMSGTYTLIITNTNGCVDTATTSLTVNPKPSASASNTGPYCGGETIELTSSPASMATYEWSGPLGFTSDEQNPIRVSADTSFSGTYTVIVTSLAGCVDTAITDVVVNPKPEILAFSNGPICVGSLLELRAEPDGLDSYFWFVPGGSIIPGRVIYRNPVTPDMAGLYHVIATNTFGCADTAWVTAIVDTVMRTLTIDSVTADSSFIYGGSITELHCNISGADGDVTYHWEPIGAILDPDTSDPLVAPPLTTTYIVTVRDSQDCGIYYTSDSILIEVYNEFICRIFVDSLTHDTHICSGDSVPLYCDADLEVGAVEYRWSPDYRITSTISQTPTVFPETTTIYTVIAEDDSGCVDTGYVEIEVSNIQVDIDAEADIICLGDYILLNAEISGGIEPYEVIWTPVAFVVTPDSSSTYASPETSTTFTLWAIDSMGCVGSGNVFVEVDTPITTLRVEVSADDSSLFLGASTRMHADAFDAVGSVSYSWEPSSWFDSPSSPTPWATPLLSGWLYVEVTDHQEHCEYSILDSIFIEVEDTSSCPLDIISITADTHICLGDDVDLSVDVTGATGPIEYAWTPASSLSDPTSPNPVASPAHSTFYWIRVSDDSCMDSARVIIYVDTVRTGMRILSVATTFDTIAIGDSTLLFSSVTGESGDLYVHWYPDIDLDSPDSIETWAHPLVPTTYLFVAIDSQECGHYMVFDSVHVHVITWFGCSLSVDANGADSICMGGSAGLTAIPDGAVGTVSYEWTPHSGLSDPYTSNPIASPSVTTTYTVTAVDDSGCIDTDAVTVWVKAIDESGLPPLDICLGDTIGLMLSMHAGVAPITWSWSPTDFLSDPGVASPLCWAESSITYEVVAIDAEGCADTVDVDVIVDSVRTGMTVAISPDTAIASGGTAHLRAEILGPSGHSSFVWSPPSWLDDPGSLTPNATPPAATMYHFIASDSQSCGIYQVNESVFVDILPDFECSLRVESAFAETSVCLGGSVELNTAVFGALGDVFYEWTPATYLDFSDSANPIASGLDSTITYTVIASDDSCSDTASVRIFVTRAAIIGDSLFYICRGDTVELSGELYNPRGSVIYSWLPAIGLSSPDSNYTLAFPDTSITYRLFAVDEYDCDDSISIRVEVDSVIVTMVASAIVSSDFIEPGDSTLLTVVVDDEAGELSYHWEGPSGSIASPEYPISWAFPDDSAWFFVTVRDSQECGVFISTDSVYVRVGIDPCSLEISIEGVDSVCRGDTTFLIAHSSGANGPVEWRWRPSGFIDDSTADSISAYPEMTSFCWAVARDTLGCTDSLGFLIVVRETPSVLAFAIDDSLTPGETLELRGFPTDTQFSYNWSGPDGFSSDSQNVEIADIGASAAGWYILTVTNELGCSGLDSILIAVLLQPKIDAIPAFIAFDLFEEDTISSESLIIYNIGDSILSILLIELANALPQFEFEAIAPVAIEPSEAETLSVTFTAHFIDEYYDTLEITSNDPDMPILPVPLIGRVHGPSDPDIIALPPEIDFGIVQIDSCEVDSTYISNAGGGILVIYMATPQDPSVRFLRPPLPDSLSSHSGRYYVFEFCPTSAGSLHTWIDAQSNDPNDAIYNLLALGLGVHSVGYSVNTEILTPNGDGRNDILIFAIPDDVTDWRVAIYNSRGREIAGGKLSEWDAREDGRAVPVGTYYYRITTDGENRLSGAFSVIY